MVHYDDFMMWHEIFLPALVRKHGERYDAL